ncbi:MAG TPA: S1-like domain-containing RNA-binding protein [Bacteroidia bacterium]|nr:S1-like domain-containing RNA-binding protein [Bacteroidia bacterium]
MIEIGKTNNLTIIRETPVGLHLADDDHNEVLLPGSLIDFDYKIGDRRDVFVYTDADGRAIASPSKPYAEIGGFVYLRVTSTTEFGAFLDWGLEKDLFVPYNEQKVKMLEDEFYVVHIYLDEKTNRLVASSRIDKFISNENLSLEQGQAVDLLVYEESPLGFSSIINGRYKGLIYHNDIYQEVFVGDELKGYVKTIRPDNLIDLSFQKSGFKNVLDSTDVVLEEVIKSDGFLNLHDKSTPEEISIRLSMSKATFKKAIGILYRHKKVLIKPDGVYLVKDEEPGEDAV